MSRHSKNNTASSVFTYYERKKIQGSGTLKGRLGGDQFRKFEDCWLCLRPAVKPVCSPKGFIYCKECLLSNFASQKEEKDRQTSLWELQQQQQLDDVERIERDRKEKEIVTFLRANEDLVSASGDRSEKRSPNRKQNHVKINKEASRAGCFWVAENTPSAAADGSDGCASATTGNPTSSSANQSNTLESSSTPPSRHLVCPITKTRLRLKDLVELKPEITADDSGQVKWLCSLTRSEIGYHKAYALKPSGKECLKRGLLKGMGKGGRNVDPAKDLIPLVGSGSGFSMHNKIETSIHRPVME